MILTLLLSYCVWTEEYYQTSPNKNKSPNLWHLTNILVCCIFAHAKEKSAHFRIVLFFCAFTQCAVLVLYKLFLRVLIQLTFGSLQGLRFNLSWFNIGMYVFLPRKYDWTSGLHFLKALSTKSNIQISKVHEKWNELIYDFSLWPTFENYLRFCN